VELVQRGIVRMIPKSAEFYTGGARGYCCTGY